MTDTAGSTFSELVVAVDGHDSDSVAIAHSAALAERLGIPLTLLRQVSRHGLGRATREEMELLADRCSAIDVTVRVVEAEQPETAIVDVVKDRPRALLCMATRAPSAAGQLLFGSVAVEVARYSPVPVWLIGPAVRMPQDGPAATHVAVCLDGSDAAERALGLATSFARDLELPVELCQAVGAPDGQAFEWGYLARTVEGLGGMSRLDWKLVHNEHPADGLSGLTATDGPALLVLATHARRIGERFRQGSVAMDVVSTSATPVLVLGPSCHHRDTHEAT